MFTKNGRPDGRPFPLSEAQTGQLFPGFLHVFLELLVGSAKEAIESKGIFLDMSSYEDAHLVVMYASWLYRKRNGNEAMPRMLQYELHSRLIHEKGGGAS